MNSQLADDFIRCFQSLPDRIKQKARKNYKLWKQNPSHTSLHFKKVHEHKPVYSVRVGIGWRAVGMMEGDTIIWFWIGSHSAYEKLLSRL